MDMAGMEAAGAVRIDEALAQRLEAAVARINQPEFAAADPVQFPRMFSSLQDVEVVAFTAAIMAWGRRDMILRDCRRLFLDEMSLQPFRYLMEEGWRSLADRHNIHRTLFGEHLKWLYTGLRAVYKRFGSLDAFCSSCGAAATEAPAWHFAQALAAAVSDENGGALCSQCLPTNFSSTALKRINMALRWLVRNDGIVDLGVWRSLTPSQLFIPLDVHVGNVSRSVGLLHRKSNDRKAVEELTAVARTLRPTDPVALDFALFGLGVESKK